MKANFSSISLAMLTAIGALCLSGPAASQVADGTTRKAVAAGAEAKAKIDVETTALRSDVKAAEAKLSDMKQAGAVRWREFEADVSAATARLRKATEKAMG